MVVSTSETTNIGNVADAKSELLTVIKTKQVHYQPMLSILDTGWEW